MKKFILAAVAASLLILGGQADVEASLDDKVHSPHVVRIDKDKHDRDRYERDRRYRYERERRDWDRRNDRRNDRRDDRRNDRRDDRRDRNYPPPPPSGRR